MTAGAGELRLLEERVTRLEMIVGDTGERTGDTIRKLLEMLEAVQAASLETQKAVVAVQGILAGLMQTMNTGHVRITDDKGRSVALLGVGATGAGQLVLWDPETRQSVRFAPGSKATDGA